MADHEPTTSELGRWMQRLEGRVDDVLRELKTELRQLADEVRRHTVKTELLEQRVNQGEQRVDEATRAIDALDKRLRVVETDLATRTEGKDKSRRAAAWISAGISAAGLAITIIVQFLG